MITMREFLEKKNVKPSIKLYLNDALSAMALGLFCSLLIGLILKTAGEQLLAATHFEVVSQFLIDIGTIAMSLMGAAIGASVAWRLSAPPLVLFSALVMGQLGANSGGPAGAFVVALIATEIGKLVSKETKADIIVTPAVSIVAGGILAELIAPAIQALMIGLGDVVMSLTKLHPVPMGIAVAVVVGLVLTAPISSAALCIMLNLSGIAAGAATVGCCAQMIGFAAAGIRENGVGAVLAQAVGTSMIQLPNIIKNPWILVPPTLAAAVLGPIAIVGFDMENIAVGAGMGTSGFVGQIGTLTAMGFSAQVLLKIAILQFLLPAAISYIAASIMRKIGIIKNGDYTIQID